MSQAVFVFVALLCHVGYVQSLTMRLDEREKDLAQDDDNDVGRALEQPLPYRYESFMKWVRGKDWSKIKNLELAPDPAEFDIDLALEHEKFGAHLKSKDAQEVARVAKSINKWPFLVESWTQGSFRAIAAPQTHLYIMSKLRPWSQKEGSVFLDAGSGTGYLLLFWLKMAQKNANVIGIEQDYHMADMGFMDEVLFEQLKQQPDEDFEKDTPRPYSVKRGDLVSSPLHVLRNVQPDNSIDAINVGAAVQNLGQLDIYKDVLKPGGAMIAAICNPAEEQTPEDIADDRCTASLNMYKKNGKTLEMVGEGIPVRYVVAKVEETGPEEGEDQDRGFTVREEKSDEPRDADERKNANYLTLRNNDSLRPAEVMKGTEEKSPMEQERLEEEKPTNEQKRSAEDDELW